MNLSWTFEEWISNLFNTNILYVTSGLVKEKDWEAQWCTADYEKDQHGTDSPTKCIIHKTY